MNDPNKRSRPALAILAVALALFVIWAAWAWTTARDACLLAREELATCEHLANEIESLRRAPVKVDETAQSSEALAKLVESTSQKIGLGTDRIVHVAPGEPRRIGETPYLEQATAVELREVTLRQLIESTLAIGQAAPRLKVASVAVRTPPGDSSAAIHNELWNVQFVLTAHVYAPKMPTPP